MEHTPFELIQKIASDAVIDTAYEWLCKRRSDYSHNDEVWDIRFSWAEFKPHLQRRLLREEYTISSQIVINTCPSQIFISVDFIDISNGAC